MPHQWTTYPLTLLLLMVVTIVSTNIAVGDEFLDRIKLRSGAELRVKIIAQPKDEKGAAVVFETESGAVVKLQRKLIASILEADEANRAYQNHLKTYEDSVAWHRAMVEWCKDQRRGRTKFKDEIEYHLEAIVRIDPDDVKARKLLGYERLGPGVWMLENLLLDRYGYEVDGAKVKPRLFRLIENGNEQFEEAEGTFKKSFKQWQRDVKSGRDSAANLQQRLFDLCNEKTVSFIFEEHAMGEQNALLRGLYLEAIGRVPTPSGTRALSWFAANDSAQYLRERATAILRQPGFNKDVAMKRISASLGHPDNGVINGAAVAIGELADDGPNEKVLEVMLRLTDALVTTHQFSTGARSGAIETTFTNDGLQSFSAGDKPQTVQRTLQNGSVLAALRKMTGKDFGFNEKKWEQFFVNSYSFDSANVRTDN